MSILDAIGGGLTAATKAATADVQGNIQGSQLLRAIMMQQAQQDHLRAQTAQAVAGTQHTLHQDKAPVLGEPGYAAAEGEVAGAKVNAETPGLVNREKLIAPVKTQEKVNEQGALAPGIIRQKQAESNIEEGREGRLIPKRIAAQNASAHMGLTAAKDFETQTKAYTGTVPKYAQVKNALAEARAGNPAALKSALLSYAAVADPNAQLRQGVMNYVTQVNPSFVGNLEMALDRMTSGQIPPEVLDNMEKMVDRLHQTNAGLYEQRRSAYVGRLPSTEPYIAPTDEVFKVPGITAGGASAAPAGGTDPFAHITPKRP